jgi:hypothetical protein
MRANQAPEGKRAEGRARFLRPAVIAMLEISIGGVVPVALLLGVWSANSSPDLTVVALAMAIILGNILGGPVLLGRALAAEPDEQSAEGAAEPALADATT